MEFYWEIKMQAVYFKCPHMRDFGRLPNGPAGWTTVSIDPLTVTPSILNEPCGCHGFITNGQWVGA